MADDAAFVGALPSTLAMLDILPVSVILYRMDGMAVVVNSAAERLWRADRSGVVGYFNILQDQQSVDQGSQELFARVQAGEVVVTAPVQFDTGQVAEVIVHEQVLLWIQATMFGVRDSAGEVTHVGIIHQDVTERINQMHTIEAAQYEISGQREAILALSSPVIQVWEGILTLPLVGQIDARRAQAIIETLLTAIVEHQAEVVIIDVTGVAVIDTMVANYLISAARAAQLLGSQVVLSGISAEIAQTLVQIGFDGSNLITHANLRSSIVWAFAQQGLQVVAARNKQ
jgi:anti-anti-sigma factor